MFPNRSCDGSGPLLQGNCDIDVPEGCKGTAFNLLTEHMFHALTQAHAMSDLCRGASNKSRNITTLLAVEFPPLPTDLNGRGDKLISFRTMAYRRPTYSWWCPVRSPRKTSSSEPPVSRSPSKKPSSRIITQTRSAHILTITRIASLAVDVL